MLSKSFLLSSSEKTKNYNNAPSIKSIFWPILNQIHILSGILICSKHLTIFTSFTSIVMVVRYRDYFLNKENYLNSQHCWFLNKFWKLFKSLTSTILCTETLNRIIFFSITESSSWEILAFAKTFQALMKWHEPCLVHQFTWHHKSLRGKFTLTRQTYGLSVWFFSKWYSVIAHSNQIP